MDTPVGSARRGKGEKNWGALTARATTVYVRLDEGGGKTRERKRRGANHPINREVAKRERGLVWCGAILHERSSKKIQKANENRIRFHQKQPVN